MWDMDILQEFLDATPTAELEVSQLLILIVLLRFEEYESTSL
jgi:hypothetical protein